MSKRPDLDDVMDRSNAALDPSDELDDVEVETYRHASANDVPALVAELLVARRLHRAAQLWRDGEDLDPDAIEAELLDALGAYDETIKA
jgi:hypothetical protein